MVIKTLNELSLEKAEGFGYGVSKLFFQMGAPDEVLDDLSYSLLGSIKGSLWDSYSAGVDRFCAERLGVRVKIADSMPDNIMPYGEGRCAFGEVAP